MKYSGLFKIAGFLMFLFGGCAVFLSFVGVDIYPLVILEKLGTGTAFLIKLIMMILGIVITLLASSTKKDEEDDKDMYIRRNENY